jgi:hypothetical protein
LIKENKWKTSPNHPGLPFDFAQGARPPLLPSPIGEGRRGMGRIGEVKNSGDKKYAYYK